LRGENASREVRVMNELAAMEKRIEELTASQLAATRSSNASAIASQAAIQAANDENIRLKSNYSNLSNDFEALKSQLVCTS
jgi:hypothetical protein